jgi:hypothetical protein
MWSYLLMMNRGVVLGVVVSHVVGAGFPIDDELFLRHPVSDPIESHVNGSRLMLFFYAVVCNSGCCGIVRFEWGGRLWMA